MKKLNPQFPSTHRSVFVARTVFLVALVAAIVFVSSFAEPFAEANVLGAITVNTTSDVTNGSDGFCTLREAITAANNNAASGATPGECAAGSGDDTITITASGTINLTGVLPDILSNMTISGPGSSSLTVRRDTGGDYRIFSVGGSPVVSVSGLTVANGKAADGTGTTGQSGGNGGGINQLGGILTLTDVTVSGNTSGNGAPNTTSGSSTGGWGGHGAGIYSTGNLTMTNCVVSGNTTGNGANGGSGGSGGRGGGIYFGAGVISLTNVVVNDNHTGTAGGPTGGNSGYGGGIWIEGSASAAVNALTNVTITNNTTGNTVNGEVGGGAGLYILAGQASLTNSSVSNNHVGNSTNFGAGSGGGIFNNGNLIIRDSLISGNDTGNQTTHGSNTVGGGIANNFMVTIVNSTISGNSTGSGFATGGGLYNGGTMKMYNCTVTGNISTSTDNCCAGHGVVTGNAAISVGNSIIARNGPGGNGPDLSGYFSNAPFNSRGHNLIGNVGFAAGFTNGTNGDQVGTLASPLDPRLAALANNGGPTQTHALLPNSTALDAGNDCVFTDTCSTALGFSLTTDQRGAGFSRSVDGNGDGASTVDIGAYEVQAILVTNTNDSGPGSLRQAITDANVNADTNAINFQAGLTGTISLLSALPDLTTSMSINGPGANLMRVERNNSAATDFGIFLILIGNHNVSFYGLTISGGRLNGGISYNGTGIANITDCAITGNTAAAMYGGGVRNGYSGTMNIMRSTISGNSTMANGGGLAVLGGTVNVTNSTISGNSCSGQGGGIDVNSLATVTLTNCTITNNRGDDLGNSGGGAGGLTNGGFGAGKPFLKNTIVAGNFTGTGTTASDINGPMDPASSFNLIGTGIGMGISNGSNGNQIGTAGSPLNPLLGTLANNGGTTFTHALLVGSPAIDAGSNALSDAAGLTTDQRGAGFARSTDGNGDGTATVDIGAYEVGVILVTNTDDSGPGSLRQAITDANANDDTNAINFQPGLTGTITLLSALPDLSTSMSINGPGAIQMIVQRSTAGGTPNFRIFKINSGTTVTIRNLTISNGKFINSGDFGAGVLNNGVLTLAGCNIYGNQTIDLPERGGGIYSDGPSLIVNDCNIGGLGIGQPNIGGGIVSIGSFAKLLITGGSVVGNTSGGIFFAGGDAILTGVSITNNTGTSATGGFGSNGSTPNVKIINCLIANNTGQNGGGLRNAGGTHLVMNTTISGNTSLAFGGGLDNAFGNTTLINVTITNNRAQDGGGVFNWSGAGQVLLSNTVVAGNFRGASPSTTPGDITNLVSSSSSFSLIGACDGCGLSNGVNNNQVGVADPRLAVLANYGGPTQTHALLPSSPALNAGSNALATNAGLTTDQRGFPRITNTTVDIGSFESRGFTIAASGGTPQSASILTAFSSPLVATVSSAFGEPVAGGVVTFAAPLIGASGTFPGSVSTVSVTINASGLATAPTFTANGIAGGPYSVVANLAGGSPSANFSLTNLKGNQTITVNTHAPATATYNTSFTVAATSSSGLAVSYSSSGSCTNVGAMFTMTSGTGTCTVKYDQAGDTNYNAATQVTESVTAQKASQTITVNTHAPANATYNTQFTVAATASSALGVSYSSSGSCTNVGATFTMTSGTGICTVKYDQAGDTNFNAATQVTESVTAQTATTTTNLSSSLNPSPFGQSVTFTATVTSTAGTPTGTVTFKDNGVAITGCSNKPLAFGQATCDASGLGSSNHPITADYSGDTNFATSIGTLAGGQVITPPPSIQFSSPSYNESESGSSTIITVTRTGDTSGASSVNFSTGNNSYVPCNTINGVTSQNCDFIISSGTLNFAAGQTSGSFEIIIIDDVYVEGNETLSLSLSSPSGAVLGSQSTAPLTIIDNDSVVPATNPLDDARYFVRTHYYDFLGRLPDDGGLDYWTNEITQCGSNTACINERRAAVSNAFFYEQEYQQTASYVFLLYRASFGNNQPFPNPDPTNVVEARKLPDYLTFVADRVQVIGGSNLAQSQLALANAFVQRPEFITRYPLSLSTAAQFVDEVLATIRNDSGAELISQRDTLIGHFNTGGRGLVMFHLANDYWNGCNRLPGSPPAPCVPVGYGDAVDNRSFVDAEYNRSFVYSQYSGYLRRGAEIAGFLFWLNEVSKAPPRNVGTQRAMVCSFITSQEYQLRFSSVVTHSNAECGN